MPQAAAAWIFSTVYLSAGAAAAYTAAVVFGYLGTTLLITSALAAISKQLMPTPKQMRGITQEYGDTVGPRRIIYGEVRVSGMNVIPPVVSGLEGEYLHQVLVLCGHAVSDIPSVFFDQTKIADAIIGSISGADTDGVVTNGDFSNYAWIRRYDGTQTSADYILKNVINMSWNENDVGYGMAYLALRYKFSKSVYGQIGKPEVSALVQGKIVYDPRLDTSPGANPTNAAYKAYSSNPALCLADYLVDTSLGMGEDTDRINWTLVGAAANICDEVVQIPTGASPQATTQKRYTCNTVLDATDRFEDNIERLCACMMGHCYYSGGEWQIHAGAWSASAFALTEDDVIGGVSVRTDMPRSEKYNAVRGQFFDSLREYQPSEFQPMTDSAYETADGERIWREIELLGTTNEYEAQRDAIIVLKRSRNRRSVTADFGMTAFKVKPFETGTLTLSEIGWSAQPVRCTSWEFRPDGSVRLSLTEENEADWDDPAIGDYTYVAGVTEPSPSGYVPPTPTSLTATAVTGGTLLRWTIASMPNNSYMEIWRAPVASPMPLFAQAERLSTTYDSRYTDFLISPGDYVYWVAAVSPSGTRGTQYPSSGTGVLGAYRWVDNPPTTLSSGGPSGTYASAQVGTPLVSVGSGGLAASVSPAYRYPSLANGSQSAGTVSAVVSGGTAPYTYAWTDSSSKFSVNSPTSASSDTTSFSTNDEYEVTITLTVTDSASPQNTAVAYGYWSIIHGTPPPY